MSSKSVQSNFRRGTRRGTVGHVCRKVPLGYNGAPQKYPFPWTDPQTPLRAHPWAHLTYVVKRHPDPIRRFFTMHWTDRCTGRPTDRPRKSLITISRCATTATRPKNEPRENDTTYCERRGLERRGFDGRSLQPWNTSEHEHTTTVADVNNRRTMKACRQTDSSTQPQASIVSSQEKHVTTSTD